METEKYTVQSGDTLASIALKFDISVEWLKKINDLVWSDLILPGDVLLVRSENAIETAVDPVEVGVFDVQNPNEIIEGKIMCIGEALFFESPGRAPLIFNMWDIVETGVGVHPFDVESYVDCNDPDNIALMTITVLTEVDGDVTICSHYFQGKRAILQSFHDKVKPRITEARENHKAETKVVTRKPVGFAKVSLKPLPAKPQPVEENKVVVESEEQKKEKEAPKEAPVYRERTLPPVEMIGKSNILTEKNVCDIRTKVPYRYRHGKWRLLFQLSTDGASYRQFFRKISKQAPVVMVILSDNKDKIGCFISGGFRFSRQYYGTGEIFVYRFNPELEIFKWSQVNQYFTSTSQDEIAIGGGGASAIWIDGRLLNAYSEKCPTFNSPQLSKEMGFKIINMEVWKIDS